MKRYEMDIYWLFVIVSGFTVLLGYEMTVRLHGTLGFIDVGCVVNKYINSFIVLWFIRHKIHRQHSFSL